MNQKTLQQKLTAYQLHDEVTNTDYFSAISATRVSDSKSVLLMVLNPDLPRDAYFVRRFKDMAERNMQLEHPHILHTLDVIETDSVLACVCEFPSAGQLFDTYLQQHAPLPPTEAVSLARQIATALDYAHGQAVRHGSLSAQTIFHHDGQVFLVFFGLAQLMEEIAEIEKPYHIADDRYLSPERLAGESPSRTGDLYSLAVLTYRMLAGTFPFPAQDPNTHRQPPAPLHTINPRVRPSTGEVVLRMLSRGVELRQTTGAEFVRALQVAVEGSAPMRPITATTAAIKLEPRSGTPVRISGRYIAIIAFAVTVVFLALAGGFWLITNRQNLRPPVASPAITSTPVAPAVVETQPAPIVTVPQPSPTPIAATPTVPPSPSPPPPSPTPVTGVLVQADSPFSQLVLASGITGDYKPENPGTTFSADTKKIYLFFRYSNMQAGTPWQVTWQSNGNTLETGSDTWPADYGSAGTAWVFFAPIDGFNPGKYTVSLAIDGKVVASAAFEIQ